jgi:CHASE3 domain sensor protein
MILFYILCLSLFVMGGISFFSYSDTGRRLKTLDTLYDELVAVVAVRDTIERMESLQRAYLITGDKSYLEGYREYRIHVDERCKAAVELYTGSSDRKRMEAMCDLVHKKVEIFDRTVNLRIENRSNPDVDKLFNLSFKEGNDVMDLLVITGVELENHRRADYKRVMSGLWALGTVRIYMSFTLMVAALVQMALAAVLGRSRTPAPFSEFDSDEISGEIILP